MAQHDMVIDNAPGLGVRQDINAAVQALVSTNSGPVEPLVKFPGMLWLDTSVAPNGLVKQRDLANANWIPFRLSATTPGEDIHAAPEKLAPIDADEIPISDSASTPTPWQRAKIKVSSLKAAIFGGIAALTAKTTLADADNFLITDSAAAHAAKKITWASIKTALNAVYALATHSHTTAQVTGLDAALADRVSKSASDSQIAPTNFIRQSSFPTEAASASYTPDVDGGVGNIRTLGSVPATAWTFNAPGASPFSFTMIVNFAAAGGLCTLAGFTKVGGDTIAATGTYNVYITRIGGYVSAFVEKLA